MFTNRASGEINVRVVLYGLPFAGKTTLMQRIYDDTPQSQRGQMVSVAMETERTIFFDLQRPEFGEVEGSRLRLHLYALSGLASYAASLELLLRGVDAVVFVADAQRERAEANRALHEGLQANLSKQGLVPAEVPQLLGVTKCDLDNSDSLAVVASNLGKRDGRALRVDGRSGEGIHELMGTLVQEVCRAILERRLKEWQPSKEQRRDGVEFTARARLVGHYSETFGEAVAEYDPARLAAGRPRFIVVEHAPRPDRPFWTYATAGLSLWQQAPEGPERRVELLAYSLAKSQSVVDILMVVADQIHLLDEADAPYKTFDTVTLPGMGLAHESFVLAPPAEDDALLAFPDLARRTEDVRFTHAVTGNVEDSVEVTFIHVLPVLADELKLATESGTPALLEKMNLSERGRAFGWNRRDRDSVLRKRFWGLLS